MTHTTHLPRLRASNDESGAGAHATVETMTDAQLTAFWDVMTSELLHRATTRDWIGQRTGEVAAAKRMADEAQKAASGRPNAFLELPTVRKAIASVR